MAKTMVVKCQEAERRQIKYNALTIEEKIEKARSRGGKKELIKLLEKNQKKESK